MRRCYLVCYDIREPKRLRLTHRILRAYGASWQYSVFFCVLKAIDHVRLQSDLLEVINQREDQVMIIDLGSREDNARAATTVLGIALPEEESGYILV